MAEEKQANHILSDYEAKEKVRQMRFEKIKELLLNNVGKTKTKTFTQYTKELVKNYVRNPYSSIANIRNVSNFLERNSMIYKKIIAYYAQMPLFDYNLTYKVETLDTGIDANILNEYKDVLVKLQEINMKKEFSKVIATALRDGAYYGFIYDGEGDGFLLQSLDPAYCKISAQTGTGEYIFSFDATYFDSGSKGFQS